MTILARLEEWRRREVITAQEHAVLDGLARGEPVSLSLELNILLYTGILAFVAGLGWTVSTWSQQLGAILILAILAAILTACCWYCFTRTPAWSRDEVPSPDFVFDYVIYLGALTWGVGLAYIENHFHLLSGQWDSYLLASACLYFCAAYRFDNRPVLWLALSSLAGWFGLTISHWPSNQDSAYRQYAIVYSLLAGGTGAMLRRAGLKAHFFSTYLNLAANVLFWALLSGVFKREGSFIWLPALVGAATGALAWGLARREFSFVAYAAVYGYPGVSSVLLRYMQGTVAVMSYFVITGVAMLLMLVRIARRFGRDA